MFFHVKRYIQDGNEPHWQENQVISVFQDVVIGRIRNHEGYIVCIMDTQNNRFGDLITNQKAP